MGLFRCYNRRRNSFRGNEALISLTVAVVVFGVICGSVQVQGSLSLTKQCGEDTVCQALEYCRSYDHICQPCKDVCDPGNKFNEDRCVADCQDYIHDERYLNLQNSTLLLAIERRELEEKYKDLEGDVFILKLVVGICVAVILIVVACLLAFFAYFWKLMHPAEAGTPDEKKKAAGNKTASVELPTVYNNRYGVTTPTPETSPASVISSSPADTNMTTLSSTTTIPPYSAHTPPPPPLAARSSPTKSNSSVATPGTAATILMSSAASTLVNGGRSGNGFPNAIKYRREPSESTLPDNCAYDNLSMSPQHIHYSHHV